MENVIALAVQDKHSSCSEISGRAFSRDRLVINAVLSGTVQGTTVPSTGIVGAFGYALPQTDDTTLSQGDLTWSPPV